MYHEPRWRYGQVVHELKCEAEGIRYNPSSDLLVVLLKHFYRTWQQCHDRTMVPWLMEEFGPVARVFQLHANHSAGSIADAVEAAILAGAGIEFVHEYITGDLTDNDLRLYKAWFFDVDENLRRPFWVEQHVFAPAAAEQNLAKRQSGLAWKAVAYMEGPMTLLSCVRGRQVSDEDLDKLRLRCSKELDRQSAMHAHCRNPHGSEMDLMLTTRGIESLMDAQKGDDPAAKQGKAHRDMTDALLQMGLSLKARGEGANVSKTERVPTAIGAADDHAS
jgi:hypothetical protein